MSNRYIPYGYQFENGLAVPHPAESQTVREIFDRYCNGESLKQIADRLIAQAVEYSPGKAYPYHFRGKCFTGIAEWEYSHRKVKKCRQYQPSQRSP